MSDTFRTERDTMGEVRIPAHARWGPQTQRAVDNFPISGQRLSRPLIWALGSLKGASSTVNASLGVLDAATADAIHAAAAEVARGDWDDHFPVDVFQTGSGTSSNMNANEVIASLASERLGRPVHPNDHVNASQSSNDVFPSAIHLAACGAISHRLVPDLGSLAAALRAKAGEFGSVVKAGRTHLMDAVPVTLGQEFGGYARQVELGIERVLAILPRLGELPLGGSAVGTGLNVPPGFAAQVLARLAEDLDLPLREAQDHFEAQAARDSCVEASGVLRVVAVSLDKIAGDLRWMGSGPTAGLAELHLPDLQPGSSIMPGKVNPVVPEAVHQVVARVIGDDAIVAWAGARGQFELNTMMPVLGVALVESVVLLANVSRLLADRCIAGLEVDADRCRAYAESSPVLATALNPRIGYEAAARVVKRAMAERRTVRDVVVEEGLLSAAEAAQVLDVDAMTKGGLRTPPS